MIVKLLVFLTGLSIFAFLSTRFREQFTEPYTFSKFMHHDHGVETKQSDTKDLMNFDKKSSDKNSDESSGIDIGGE